MATNRSHLSLASSDNSTIAADSNNNNNDNGNSNSRQSSASPSPVPSPVPSPSPSPSLPPPPSVPSPPSRRASRSPTQRPPSTVLSPTLAPSSPLLSSCSSPPPEPPRSLNPHSLLPTDEDTAQLSKLTNRQALATRSRNSRGHARVSSWTPSTPPPPSATTAYPSHLPPTQFVDEKAAISFYEERAASPRLGSNRVSIAPSTNSFAEAAPLYDAAFAHHPASLLNKRTSSHRHAHSYDFSQGTNFLHPAHRPTCPSSPSSRPVPSDLEMQRHPHHEPYSTSSNADTSTRSRTTPRSKTLTASERSGRRSGETRRKRRSGSTRRTRLSDASTLEGTWDGDLRGPKSSNLSGISSSRRSPSLTAARHYPADHHHSHSHAAVTPAGAPQQPFLEPPPASRNPFSLFRRASVSQEATHKNRHPGDNHHVTWKGGSTSPPTRRGEWSNAGKEQYARSKIMEKVPYGGRGGRQFRKSGYPGRGGEEPETDLFNFVDVILNMPDAPSLKFIAAKMAKVLFVMTITYFVLMAMYFAAEFQSEDRLKNFDVLVVDLDKSMIANSFINFTQRDSALPKQINWSIQSGYRDVQGVIKDVDNGNYWGAIVVMPNASTALNKAVSGPDPNYDPSKAFLFIYDSGRNPLVVKPYIVASMYTQFLQFTTNFNPSWIYFVLTYADSTNTTLTPLATAPQVLGMPVAFDELDLHPPTAKIITSATSVAYIWIFLVAGGSTYFVANIVQPVARNASVQKTMLLLVGPLLVFLGCLSMAYSVLLYIFGVPFESAGHFFTLFLGMLLVQGAVASLVLFLIFMIPVVFIPPITVTFVVMNVIAVFNPVELMPTFYRWIYAMPFLNGVQISRYILMGSYNRLSYNLPILFAWILVPITFLPFAIARQKRLLMDAIAVNVRHRHPYRHTTTTYCSDSDGYYYHDGQEHHQYEFGDVYDAEPGKHGRQNHGTQRPRSTRSGQRDEETDQEFSDGTDGDRDKDDDSESESASSSEGEEGGRNKEGFHSSRNTVRLMGSLNPRPLGNGPSPSAPPESQIFDTPYRLERQVVDQDRSVIEMPKLSRQPYASELVRPPTPDEVK
ncbi:hypothetical protein F5H01DRAFT_339705 [Linnemannia elongata]|nr:hypothetical protein F5H01DRAFT_339705 [Linnemannia elongata]